MRERAPDVFGESARLPVPDGAPAAREEPADLDVGPAPSGEPVPVPAAGEYDPLRLCIYTTIGLIAWLLTPALTVALFGTIGVVGYVRARRRGLASSRCYLGDTRLVIAYLGLAALAGAGWTVWRIFG